MTFKVIVSCRGIRGLPFPQNNATKLQRLFVTLSLSNSWHSLEDSVRYQITKKKQPLENFSNQWYSMQAILLMFLLYCVWWWLVHNYQDGKVLINLWDLWVMFCQETIRRWVLGKRQVCDKKCIRLENIMRRGNCWHEFRKQYNDKHIPVTLFIQRKGFSQCILHIRHPGA